MSFRTFVESVFDTSNHEDCPTKEKYNKNGYYPRFGGIYKPKLLKTRSENEENSLEDCKVGLMFAQANYTNIDQERSWKDLNDPFSGLAKYHDGMINDWIKQHKTRNKVCNKIENILNCGTTRWYVTDFKKCEGGCQAEPWTNTELDVLAEESSIDLWIPFGGTANQAFPEAKLKLIGEYDELHENSNKLSDRHGRLYCDERDDYNWKVLPLLLFFHCYSLTKLPQLHGAVITML